MSYAICSEVYFAKELTTKEQPYYRFKIGETENARRRNGQLYRDYDLCISLCAEVGGDKSYRLLLESFLRFYINNHYDCHLVGQDTFTTHNKKVMEQIEMDFFKIIEKFEKILSEST